jgi:CelD/BcsL family acetyltransferase involved in cellulose biosynthesis
VSVSARLPRYVARHATIADLDRRHDEWRALIDDAIESNPFYAPSFLGAAQRHLHPGRPIDLVIVEDAARGDALCGLLPLERPHLRDGLLWGARALYRNPFTCLTCPLIRTEDAPAILAAALIFIGTGTRRLLIPMVADGRGFSSLLRSMADTRDLPLARVDTRIRAAVETTLDADDYRIRFWKKDTRSNARRRIRRLEALGTLTCHLVRHDDPGAAAALEAFLSLEAGGWKGRQNSALLQKPETAAFARAAFLPAEAGSTVFYEVLALDGRAIAVNINLVAQGVGFALKSAYDESFASYGIGALLDGYSLALATTGGPLNRLDSCAPLSHPIHRRWRQRQDVSRYLLGLAPEVPVAGVAAWLARLGPFGVWRGLDTLPQATPAPGTE